LLIRNIIAAVYAGDSARMPEKYGYSEFPGVTIRETFRLIKAVKRDLRRIVAPLLIVHATEDDMASLANARFLAAGVASPAIETFFVDDSYHVLTLDRRKDDVAERTRAGDMASGSPFLSVPYAQCRLALVGRSNARDLLRAEGDRADRVLIVVAVLVVFARFLVGHLPCAASTRCHQDILLDCTGFTRVHSLSLQILPKRYITKHPTAAYEFAYRNRYAARRPVPHAVDRCFVIGARSLKHCDLPRPDHLDHN